MTDKSESKRRVFWIAMVGFAIFVVYPLSVGPVAWLVKAGVLPEYVEAVYVPLGFAIADKPKARRLLGRYENYWIETKQPVPRKRSTP